MLRLSKIGIESVKNNLKCRKRLWRELKKDRITIDRWIKTNSVKLTMAQALIIISEETKLTMEELLQA